MMKTGVIPHIAQQNANITYLSGVTRLSLEGLNPGHVCLPENKRELAPGIQYALLEKPYPLFFFQAHKWIE